MSVGGGHVSMYVCEGGVHVSLWGWGSKCLCVGVGVGGKCLLGGACVCVGGWGASVCGGHS